MEEATTTADKDLRVRGYCAYDWGKSAFETSVTTAIFPAWFAYLFAEANGISPVVAKFVLPLGATMNMDGSAIGFPCAAIFLALAQGMSLGVGDMAIIVLMASLMSMGAAPIPSAGLVMLLAGDKLMNHYLALVSL